MNTVGNEEYKTALCSEPCMVSRTETILKSWTFLATDMCTLKVGNELLSSGFPRIS